MPAKTGRGRADADVQRLVKVAHPVRKKLQRLKLFGIAAAAVGKHSAMGGDGVGNASVVGAIGDIDHPVTRLKRENMKRCRFGMCGATHPVGP